MGFGAILAGAAGGLNSGWEDNREDAKEKAKQAFQEHLLGIQNANNIARDDVKAGQASDLLAEREGYKTEAVTAANTNAEGVATKLQAGKMAQIGLQNKTKPRTLTPEQKFMQQEWIALSKKSSMEMTEQDVARKKYLAAQLNMNPPAPPRELRAPTEAHNAEMLKNMGNPKFKASYIANFGQEHFDALGDQPGGAETPDSIPKQKTLSQKYPSNKQGPLKGILESVNPWSDKQTSKEQQSRADSIMKSMDRVSQALAKGAAPEGMDMSILSSAMGLPWIPKEKKAEIENLYKKAAGR